eukprot:Sdes_comp18165_c0_seq2m7672
MLSCSHPSLKVTFENQQPAGMAIPKTQSRTNLEQNIEERFEKFNFTISHDDLESGVRTVIHHFMPHWNPLKICLKQFTEGMTNKLFCCTLPGVDDKILIRIYGKNTDHLIDREQEIVNMVSLSSNNLAPRLYGRFENGCVYGFFNGCPLDVDSMKDSHIALLIARRLGEWHSTHIPGDMAPLLFVTLQKWYNLIPKNYQDPQKDAVFQEKVNLKLLSQELSMLQKIAENLQSPVVFAHNDLLCKNIVYDSSTDLVNFIDYEYGTYNYRGFDIGNHFCEFAGMEDPMDFSRYPDKDFQLKWLSHYLRYLKKKIPSNQEIESLYKEVQVFALVIFSFIIHAFFRFFFSST